MADRSSAELFWEIFEYLAAKEPLDRDAAKKFWKLTGNYDFPPYQIGADGALLKLGLARHIVVEDEQVVDYAFLDGTFATEGVLSALG